MEPRRGEVQSTLSLIDNSRLPHPSGALLSSFVTEALNPVVAARYMNDRLRLEDAHSVVSDWIYIVESITRTGKPYSPPDAEVQHAITRRDGAKCCVTGKAGTLLDPLIVEPILPIPLGWLADKPRVFNMLGAFFGPSYRDWWLSHAANPQRVSPYSNHWLVRSSTARALKRGLVGLQRQQQSMIEYEINHVIIGLNEPIDFDGSYPLLGDHSRSGVEKVDPRFVGTQARLCRSIQFLDIAEAIAPQILTSSLSTSRLNPPPKLEWVPRSSRSLTAFLANPLLGIWRLFPGVVRISAYEMLRKLGRRIYGGPADHSNAQRLPFGLYLKSQGESDDLYNEFNALKLIHKHTSIPAPEPLDVVVGKADANDPWDSPSTYLLISRVPGDPLSRCQDIMADGDFEHIAYQMKDYLSQLRDVPKEVNPDNAICNTLGKACRDPRINGGEPAGPFVDEAAFSQSLRFSDDPSRRGHKIVLTHADLNPRNILVQRDGRGSWRVSGIVDWETSGYYPEYWDYTKALFEGFRWPLRYSIWVKRVFAEFGDYSHEFDVEAKAWGLGDGL